MSTPVNPVGGYKFGVPPGAHPVVLTLSITGRQEVCWHIGEMLLSQVDTNLVDDLCASLRDFLTPFIRKKG